MSNPIMTSPAEFGQAALAGIICGIILATLIIGLVYGIAWALDRLFPIPEEMTDDEFDAEVEDILHR